MKLTTQKFAWDKLVSYYKKYNYKMMKRFQPRDKSKKFQLSDVRLKGVADGV